MLGGAAAADDDGLSQEWVRESLLGWRLPEVLGTEHVELE